LAELLSQLSSVRSRTAAAHSISTQLQQLEMQLHSTRYALSLCEYFLSYVSSVRRALGRSNVASVLGSPAAYRVGKGMVSSVT